MLTPAVKSPVLNEDDIDVLVGLDTEEVDLEGLGSKEQEELAGMICQMDNTGSSGGAREDTVMVSEDTEDGSCWAESFDEAIRGQVHDGLEDVSDGELQDDALAWEAQAAAAMTESLSLEVLEETDDVTCMDESAVILGPISDNKYGGSGGGGADIRGNLPFKKNEVPGVTTEPSEPKVVSSNLSYADSASAFSFESLGSLDDESMMDDFVDLAEPFDMELLRSCIEKGSPVLDDVKDKDVILVLGKTGVGKSTFIQGIAGRKITQATHKTNVAGQVVMSDVFEAVDPIAGFDIGHKKVSKTKSLSSLTREIIGNTKNDVVYVDSPGFEDTSAPEVDIANAVMMSQVTKKARSLRFVVLINYATLLEDRGGAMRSFLKLAQVFVANFEQDKTSFMFLFTHVNGIENRASFGVAKTHLSQEVLRILDGTDDTEVVQVLKFIKTSLHKSYQFVDVLHPLYSDYTEIAKFAESKLKPAKNALLRPNCGLTTQAKLKLTGQLQFMKISLHRILANSLIPKEAIEELKSIRETVRYLNLYVGGTEIQRMVATCEQDFNICLAQQRLHVEEQLDNATNSSGIFEIGNAQTLKIASDTLAAFSDGGAASYNQKRVDDTFRASFNLVLTEFDTLSFEKVLGVLGKLRAWSIGFPQFAASYQEACRFVQTKTCIVTTIDLPLQIGPNNSAMGKISALVVDLLRIQDQLHLCHRLQIHGIDTSHLNGAMEALTGQLCAVMKNWSLDGFTRNYDKFALWDVIPSQLELAIGRASQLESILLQTQNFKTLNAECAHTLHELQSIVIEGNNALCSDLMEKKFDTSQVQEKLARMSRISCQAVKGTLRPYHDVIAAFKSDLNTRALDLEQLARQSPLLDGEGLVAKLLAHRELSWFDDFVPAPFVGVECARLHELCRIRIDRVVVEAYRVVKNLAVASKGSHQLLPDCYQAVTEMKQFEKFPPDQFWNDRSKETKAAVIQCIREYRKELITKSKQWSHNWLSKVKAKELDEVAAISESLNAVLLEIQVIESFESMKMLKECAAQVKKMILEAFEYSITYVRAEFSKPDNYQSKAECLACMAKVNGYQQMQGLLPSLAKYQEKARIEVSEAANRLENLLQECANQNKIQIHFRNFEQAKVLDPYTKDEATSRLRTLRIIRTKNSTEHKQHLEEKIRGECFKGLGPFLRPLSLSKNVLEKDNFLEQKRNIRHVLESRSKNAHARLGLMLTEEDAAHVGKSIGILEEAGTELSFMFPGDWNPSKDAKSLKDKLSGRLSHLIEAVHSGCSSSDCMMMAVNLHKAAMIFQAAQPFLNKKVKDNFLSANQKTEKILDQIPELVQNWCSSYFRDAGCLSKLLPSLELASRSKNPELPRIVEVRAATQRTVTSYASDKLNYVLHHVGENKSYVDGIAAFEAFNIARRTWMDGYVNNISIDGAAVVDTWKSDQSELEAKESNTTTIERFQSVCARLDKLKNPNITSEQGGLWAGKQLLDRAVRFISLSEKTYKQEIVRLTAEGHDAIWKGQEALKGQNWSVLEKKLHVLTLLENELSHHVPVVVNQVTALKKNIVQEFAFLCQQASQHLNNGGCFMEGSTLLPFQAIFPDIRHCLLRFSFVLNNTNASKEFFLVTELVHKVLVTGVDSMKAAIANYEFSKTRSLVLNNRTDGGFLVDNFVLLKEEVKQQGVRMDMTWLERISCLCTQFYSGGRDLANIKSCAILGVVPSANEIEIKRAFKQKAREVHPDKVGEMDAGENRDAGADFRHVKEACDILINSSQSLSGLQPFDDIVRKIPFSMKVYVQECLQDQKYEHVEKLLHKISDLEMICDLVDPKIDGGDVRQGIVKCVQDCVHALKISIETQWNDRKYKELNYSIRDLKHMQSNLQSFPDIFPEAWNRSITEKVEHEIDALGQKARAYLRDKLTATAGMGDFRRCFIDMGFVLVELQTFKDYTKSIMFQVLESCLKSDWGYCYLFELGLSFHKGDEALDENENRVAQTLLSEFPHFKEVMTMVWNEETLTKPVEDTVNDITCEYLCPRNAQTIEIDRSALLSSFHTFEAEYNKLLGSFLDEDTDKHILAQQATRLAGTLKYLSCDSGWDCHVKAKLPILLAAVFALFTILKSGESFNRLQKSQDVQSIGQKLLMKPHNIQVLTLLHLLGCGKSSQDMSLESHLMQIRTGEGKSIILGAAAAMLGLLGFKVRCVCYSEYLSCRDHTLFQEVFEYLSLGECIKYSTIATFSEDATASKGDIRAMTETFLQGELLPLPPLGVHPAAMAPMVLEGRGESPFNQEIVHPQRNAGRSVARSRVVSDDSPTDQAGLQPRPSAPSVHQNSTSNHAVPILREQASPCVEEILLIDEVDVFFGTDFYGQTYNKVMELREPEISEILRLIWDNHNGQKQKLIDIQSTDAYLALLQKMPNFQYLIDNEVRLMLDHVHRVDEERYYLDADRDLIGYKVHDTVSYQVTYGYRTVFAYLKEAHAGNLSDVSNTLRRVLNMPIPCGQFSYAAISPTRILGVSGTLKAMGDFEKKVLFDYGVEKFYFVPSVYGESNFVFDKAGDGIFIESSKSDYFQKICDEVKRKTQEKRAVIVFFEDREHLDAFTSSNIYPRLGRQKATLTENMDAGEKAFIINKAATAGQVTFCTAVFGRGTDFFCKDDRVQTGGGVHVIQAFLSLEQSEEVQIQGRTSRQGKKGSYQLVLLEEDLNNNFNLLPGSKDSVPIRERYQWLCRARNAQYEQHWKHVEDNLKVAKMRDAATHAYFDALLRGGQRQATGLFHDLYSAINKPPIPDQIVVEIALLVDVTGSMTPYCQATLSTIDCLMNGNSSICAKLKLQFPDTEVKLRFGVLAYRDIDDGSAQFQESIWDGARHFTDSLSDTLSFVGSVMAQASGGSDLAEDHLGAIAQVLSWNGQDDWSSPIKLAVLFTDAPAHGYVPSAAAAAAPGVDRYASAHPLGLSADSVAGELASKGTSLIICSFNTFATTPFENKLALEYSRHPDNTEKREVKSLSMVPESRVQSQQLIGDCPRHIIFILDESGSMQHSWTGVVDAFNDYISRRLQNQNELDLVSVVQFDSSARITVECESISAAKRNLNQSGGGTRFAPAAQEGSALAARTPSSHRPTIVFMSDGASDDAGSAASIFAELNANVQNTYGEDLDLCVVAFGHGADTYQLQQISRSSARGRVHLCSDTVQLNSVFVNIAGGQQVATVLQEEIGREISDAVSDTLCLGYLS